MSYHPKFSKGTKLVLVIPGKYVGTQLQQVLGFNQKTGFYRVKNLYSKVKREVRKDKLEENYHKVLG